MDLRRALAGAIARAGLSLPPSPIPPRTALSELLSGPLVISGFFSDPRGVGRAARLTASALERAGFDPVRDDLTPLLENGRLGEVRAPSGGVWLLHCNAPEGAVAMRARAGLAAAPMYRIGAWSWELDAAPAAWMEASACFHELWTPSGFVAGAFAGSACPVTVMPHPVLPPSAAPPGTQAAGVRFATLADLRSSAVRKNPEAVLRAWEQAFPNPGEHRLVLKLLAPEADPSTTSQLMQNASRRPDVTVLDAPLSEADLARFYDGVDVVVSLHRAEGFGLTLAEAMAAGKPVIATGWSGNMEFMEASDPDQIVPFSLSPVLDPGGRYSGGVWAEPDVQAAGRLIAQMAGDADLRRRLGAANRARIAGLHARWTPDALAAAPFARFCGAGARN